MPANTIDLLPGGGPNAPGGLVQNANFGYRSSSTSGSATQPTVNVSSDQSLGFYASGRSAVALSYGTLTVPAMWATSGISVGSSANTGTLIPAISSTSSLVAAFVVQGSSSSFTWVAWPAAQLGDQILTTAGPNGAQISSVSSGLVPWSHCTVAGQIEFRLSNVSTLAQNQSSITWYFTRIAPF